MSAADVEIEPRSEEESDAGSLLDFVCDDDEDIHVEANHKDEPVELVESATFCNGTRRSMRSRAAPVRYMDPDYVSMMTEDVDIEKVISESDTDPDIEEEIDEDQDYVMSQSSDESDDNSTYSEESDNREESDYSEESDYNDYEYEDK